MTNHIKIEPEKSWFKINIKELIEYRELIGFLAWRDIMAQYKQAVFGIAWALIRPLFSVLIYTVVFGKVAKLSSSGFPYPVFTLCGLVAWNLFSTSLAQSTVSLLGNTNLITKVYFPRLILPISSLGRGIVDFIISITLFFILIAVYGIAPSGNIFFFPFFLILGLFITLGIGLIFSAISVKYHDLKHAIPFFSQMWFWITPVAYGIENIPDRLRIFFLLNPMTWIINGFRWSLLGIGDMDWIRILITAIFSLTFFLFGIIYFKRMENEFADII